MYRIYYLNSSDDITIKYIGLTKNTLKRRLNGHLYCSKNNLKKSNWIKSVLNKNEKIIINLLEDNILTLEEAYIKEIYYIEKYKKLGLDLKNLSNGGLINSKEYIKVAINKCKKKINMFNIYGDIIKSFDSLTDASKYLDTTVSNICLSIKGTRLVKNQYIFKFIGEDFSPIRNRSIPISVLDINTNNLYKFNSIKEACKQLKISEVSIRHSLDNKMIHKKFIFKKL